MSRPSDDRPPAARSRAADPPAASASPRAALGNTRWSRDSRGWVRKCLEPCGACQLRLAQAMCGTDPLRAARTYIEQLVRAGVRLAPGMKPALLGRQLVVEHVWLDGMALPDALASCPERYFSAVEELARWHARLCSAGTDARLDMNLANFMLADQGPILIDVLPPLIPSRACSPQCVAEQVLLKLCFCPRTSITALAGYAWRPAIRNATPHALDRLYRLVTDHDIAAAPPARRNPEDIFAARLKLLIDTAEGRLDLSRLEEFCRLSSVQSLLTASPEDQPRRLAEAWHCYDAIAAA